MTKTPKSTVVNIKTGEITEIVLTADEMAERAESVKQLNVELNAKLAARESALAKLAALGLTQDEIDAL